MPSYYPPWSDSTPHTDSNAKPSRYRDVHNVTVIEVVAATYRDCSPMSDFFELVNPNDEPRELWGATRAEVYCAWHGVKPPTVYPQLILGQGWKIHHNYSGGVVDNIS